MKRIRWGKEETQQFVKEVQGEEESISEVPARDGI
jgi:hypothetical protein